MRLVSGGSVSDTQVLTTARDDETAVGVSAGAGAPAGAPPRWAFWRSPADQPGWARPALLGIASLAAFLYAWNISASGYAAFYSVAVKSMSVSWKAFFYGAL